MGAKISLKDGNVKVEVLKKELLYAYSKNSTKFKVYPFSKLNDNILKNHESINEKYIANGVILINEPFPFS